MKHAPILMYATQYCPFCIAARRLLEERGLSWTEIAVDAEPEKRSEMMARSGRHTVPQIFIGDTHVGGFDDLNALDQEEGLDALLRQG